MARKKKDEQPLADEERDESAHSEESTDLVVPRSLVTEGQMTDTNIEASALVERETDTDAAVPAEEAAVHTDNVVAREASKGTSDRKTQSEKRKATDRTLSRPKQRSAKYQAAADALDAQKAYTLGKAIELAQKTSYTKFDGSVELHIRIQPKKKTEADSIRGLIQLPHGTGKTVNAVVLTDELIEQIAKDGRSEADVLIATPALMPKVAKIAKILGPQGKMPSPKAGTVTDNPEDALTALKSGRVEYRADAGGIIHQTIGKVSWDQVKLEENARALLGSLAGYQLLSVTVSATMGPGVRVDRSTLE